MDRRKNLLIFPSLNLQFLYSQPYSFLTLRHMLFWTRHYSISYFLLNNADLHVILQVLYFQHEARCSEHLEWEKTLRCVTEAFSTHVQYTWRIVRVSGCLAVIAQWQSTGGSSQRYPGFGSRWLLAFFTFLYFHLRTFKFLYFQREARCSEHFEWEKPLSILM